jgi:hypothetical protein
MSKTNAEFGMGNGEWPEPRCICSWCDKDMGPAGPGFAQHTHGICPECYAAEVAKLGVPAVFIPHSEFRTPHSSTTPHSSGNEDHNDAQQDHADPERHDPDAGPQDCRADS